MIFLSTCRSLHETALWEFLVKAIVYGSLNNFNKETSGSSMDSTWNFRHQSCHTAHIIVELSLLRLAKELQPLRHFGQLRTPFVEKQSLQEKNIRISPIFSYLRNCSLFPRSLEMRGIWGSACGVGREGTFMWLG